MSLPTIVVFFKEEKEVKRCFTNCGWFANDKTIINGIKRSLISIEEEFDWDTAQAYDKTFKKETINKS